MHLDVTELRNFYYRTSLGRAVQRAVRSQMLSLWPDARGMTVAGYGFAVPLLRPYLGQARRVISLMPAQQGVMPWPAGMPNILVLCDEGSWPLPAGIADRLVLLHGLEASDHSTTVMEEAHRVLADMGRVLFIVPNRRGLWAQRDVTPFGHGRTYSLGQIETLLDRFDLVAERHLAALYAPPATRGFWLRSSDFWERMGRRISSHLAGGVLMVEASKRLNPSLRPGLRVTERRPLRVLEGLPVPDVPRPVRGRAPTLGSGMDGGQDHCRHRTAKEQG